MATITLHPSNVKKFSPGMSMIRGTFTQNRLECNTSIQFMCQAADTAKGGLVAEDPAKGLVASRIQFLKEDLTHLFDDRGIDASAYDREVRFEDPITKYSSIQGYLANIAFLKNIFDPTFELRDIQQTGEYEITTRWTMTMKLTFAKYLPIVGTVWNPDLIFTGTSVMGINPKTGKFSSHVDTWDAVNQQDYFSLEAFIHVLSQALSLQSAPDLETPPYEVLLKRSQYEVRRYPSFTVAEAPCKDGSGFQAFNSLAGYIFGKNANSKKMDMTTPVFNAADKMQFYLGNAMLNPQEAPVPSNEDVTVTRVPDEILAVSRFGGLATEREGRIEAAKLIQKIKQDGLIPRDDNGWWLARYNDPGTLPMFRRNEVLVPLKEFELNLKM